MTTPEAAPQHTAGPWTVYTGHDGYFGDEPYILAPNPRNPRMGAQLTIARVTMDGCAADAYLMAAAPALLAALEALLEVATHAATTMRGKPCMCIYHEAASAAVEGARGGQQ